MASVSFIPSGITLISSSLTPELIRFQIRPNLINNLCTLESLKPRNCRGLSFNNRFNYKFGSHSPSTGSARYSSRTIDSSLKNVPSWEKLSQSIDSVDLSKKLNPLDKKVVLYRDTNAWCPFCLRVWLALEEKKIPYETVLIDLSNKPKWYTDIVPTALVPAITIDGEVTYESLDILWKLEKELPEHSFLPKERFGEVENALSILNKIVSEGVFFKWLGNKDEEKEIEFKQKTVEFLGLMEGLLREKEGGPFILGKFSLADCAFINPLEGAQNRLSYIKKFSIREQNEFPLISQWFEAMDSLESYQTVKADTRTSNIILNFFRKRSMESGQESPFPLIPTLDFDFPSSGFVDTKYGALRAAMKLITNHEAVVQDCLKSEIVKQVIESNDELGELEDAVDFSMRLLSVSLLIEACSEGNEKIGEGLTLPVVKKDETVVGREGVEGKRGAVGWCVESVFEHYVTHGLLNRVGIAALEHISQRVSVPRDMRAGAKVRFVANALGIVDYAQRASPQLANV